MAKGRSALRELLGREAVSRFRAGAWPDHHFVVHRRKESLPPFLRAGGLGSFDELSANYAGRIQVAGGRGEDHLQFSVSDAPASWLRRIGLTVFFGDDVSSAAEGASDWLRALEEELGAPSGVGAIRAFASPGGGGLEAHYDQGETFIVQLEGRKRIRLSPNRSYPTMQFIPRKRPAPEHYPEFAGGFPVAAPKREVRVLLQPGSVLYVPRGMWHRTEAGGASFSLSICIDTPNAIDVLGPYLQRALRQSIDWRRPLFGGWGDGQEDARARLTVLLSELSQLASSISPDELLDSAPTLMPAQKSLRGATRLQRVPTVRMGLQRRKRELHCVLSSPEGEVRVLVSEALRPAVEWLRVRRAAFAFEELKAQAGGGADLEALVRGLVEAGGLQWLGFTPLRRKG